MPSFHELSIAQLQQAVKLREQIESLQQKLDSLLNGARPSPSAVRVKGKRDATRRGGKRTVSAEVRAKMAAAQKARWAKAKGSSAG